MLSQKLEVSQTFVRLVCSYSANRYLQRDTYNTLVLLYMLLFSEMRDSQNALELCVWVKLRSLWKVSFIDVFCSETVKKLVSTKWNQHTSINICSTEQNKGVLSYLVGFSTLCCENHLFHAKPIKQTFYRLWAFMLDKLELNGGLKVSPKLCFPRSGTHKTPAKCSVGWTLRVSEKLFL